MQPQEARWRRVGLWGRHGFRPHASARNATFARRGSDLPGGRPVGRSVCLCGVPFLLRLHDFSAQRKCLRSQTGFACASQECVDSSVLVDGSQGPRRQTKTYPASQTHTRTRNLLQVGKETSSRLVVGVTYVVSCLHTTIGEITTSGHFLFISYLLAARRQSALPANLRRTSLYRSTPRRNTSTNSLHRNDSFSVFRLHNCRRSCIHAGTSCDLRRRSFADISWNHAAHLAVGHVCRS